MSDPTPVKVFLSYTHKDEKRKGELLAHLKTLEHEKLVSVWHDRKIVPGSELNKEIQDKLDESELFLLLLSSDFINSDYCYSKEMIFALQRHKAGTAVVIPIIMRPCSWHTIPKEPFPLGDLLALPQDGKVISRWRSHDDAYVNIVSGVRSAIKSLRTKSLATTATAAIDPHKPIATAAATVKPDPKSSKKSEAAISVVSFVSEWKERVSDQPGFEKGYHFEPVANTTRAAAFVNTITEEAVQTELEIVFQQIVKSKLYEPSKVRVVGDTVKTPDFTYQLTVLLNETDISEVLWQRELVIKPLSKLDTIGPIFDDDFDKLELIWWDNHLKIEELIDYFSGNPDKDWKLKFPSGKSWLKLIGPERTIVLRHNSGTFRNRESDEPHVLYANWKQTFVDLYKKFPISPFDYDAPANLDLTL